MEWDNDTDSRPAAWSNNKLQTVFRICGYNVIYPYLHFFLPNSVFLSNLQRKEMNDEKRNELESLRTRFQRIASATLEKSEVSLVVKLKFSS